MKNYFLILCSCIAFSCSEHEPVVISSDIMSYDLGDGIKNFGTVRATYWENLTTLNISLINQTPGSIRSMHFYEGNCESQENIWNMGNNLNHCETLSQDEKWSKPNIGDIGNILINNDGTVQFELTTELWSVDTGMSNDLVGKVFVIHAGPTNFFEECDPNHVPDHYHPNTKIGCAGVF